VGHSVMIPFMTVAEIEYGMESDARTDSLPHPSDTGANVPAPCYSQIDRKPADFLSSAGVFSNGSQRLIFREVEDRDLVLAARKGNVDAFNRLVSRWEKRVYNYLLRVVRNREDALDLSQETFLKAYRYLGKLEDVDRFPHWLFRIAHNEAFSQFRKERPETEALDGEYGQGRAQPVGGVPVYPLEMELAVERALDHLSPEQRETVILKVYQGFKFEEISRIQSCPVSTVKSRLYAAFDLLRDVLSPVSG